MAATEPRPDVLEVVHDLNNVLAGILNYAGLAVDGLRAELDRRQLGTGSGFDIVVDDLDQIRAAARRAVALSQQLARAGTAPDVEDDRVVMDDDDVRGPCS